MSIEFAGVTRRFGNVVALDRVDVAVRSGELTAVLGPSGSGKTSLLRSAAGLDPLDAGRILLHGADVTGVPSRQRNVGFVFQHYALFAHMTVADNVAFGLDVRPRASRLPHAAIRARVRDLLERVELEALAGRYPHQLSGGQRQRVALARALATGPSILLLDEPFGALDARVRKDLRRWLRRLHDEFEITSLFVTHDQDEALDVADRIVVINRGRIEQVGASHELSSAPATPFVAEFIGDPGRSRGCVHCERNTVHAA
jgi:sulfate transport system ATP-binding protein